MTTPPAGAPLQVHPDRLLPADPGVRALARELHASVRDHPIVSPHGHVDARLFVDDASFADPASLLVAPDHYVTRLLHAVGVPLAALGVGEPLPLPPDRARAVWRRFCEHWPAYRGTASRVWLEAELTEVFGVDVQPDAANADVLFDTLSEALAAPAFRPRALFDRFGIEVLATTDDPVDDLAAHRALADDPAFSGRVVPTFRPDRYLEAERPGWVVDLDRLGAVADVDTGTFAGWVEAMVRRRRYFVEHGAVSADHGHLDAGTEPLPADEVERVYASARRGEASTGQARALRRHLLLTMAELSADDGLVMTLHPGVLRDHHAATAHRFGPDTGHDIPVGTEFTRALRPLLDRVGTHPGFRLVLFTVDETAFSRELAPLAGFYPSVFLGAPWWFLDAPDAVTRFRAAVTETAGFAKTAGFVDDTRAFCSIPARHDMARRLDAGFLARLVAEHRLTEQDASDLIVDLTSRAREVFRL